MTAPLVVPAEVTDRPLTPESLRRGFGAHAALTREAVRTLHAALPSASPDVLAGWRILFGKWAGRTRETVPRQLARIASRYGISTVGDCDTLLLALQTYYALLVNLATDRLLGSRGGELLPDNPFSWCSAAPSAAVRQLIDRLTEALASYDVSSPASAAENGCDLFKPLYQDLFPRPLRRQLGEYYTPDWLAAHVLDQVGYAGEPTERLLDPACGSGTFLVMAIRRLREKVESGEWKGKAEGNDECRMLNNEFSFRAIEPVPPAIHHSSFIIHHFPVVGFDLNPLAVLTARANYLIAIADLLPAGSRVEVPVYLADSILGDVAAESATVQFDYVVGNPPWIAWDNLPDDYRQATKPLWERYGLFSLSGNEARHGGGKKDLSMLMLYAAADRYLKPGGRLGMVVTQTLFQTKGAGDGFRRFRLGADGPPLKVLRVDDLVALRPFGDAANWTSTIVLEKGAATEYPVPYYLWDGRREEENGECRMMNDELTNLAPAVHHSPFILHPCSARPVDAARPNSPWLISPDGQGPKHAISAGAADYTAHLGANSGGANGVYWLDVLDTATDGVRVRNVAARGKHRVETIERTIEPDLLYPLLRWSDVRRWSAVPRGHVLLAQDPTSRTGIDEPTMRKRYPRTLEYLERFRELLASRAAYRRYQQRGPFYSMYNVGPYTMAPVKVVWRRMDRQINAAVVEELDDLLLGRRPVIPQETCVLVACDLADEAHYICAVLNSTIVNDLVQAASVRGGKGFGTPGMLEFIPLRRFQPDDSRHRELAALSRQAHAAADEDIQMNIQRQIDRVAVAVLC